VNARDKFEIGDKVCLTKDGEEFFETKVHGTVAGFGRDPGHVRIVRDGQKSAVCYHGDFWCVYSRPI
jgi:hypothetical protein